MERYCLVCGSAFTTSTKDEKDTPLGAMMFYECVCEGCARQSVAEIVTGEVRLSELGAVTLYRNDVLGA